MAFPGMKIAEAFIRIGADSSGLRKELANVRRETDRSLSKASNALSRGGAGKNVGGSGGGIGGLFNAAALGKLAGPIGLVTGAFLGYARVLSEDAIPNALEAIEVERRLTAALKATGGAAGFSNVQLKEFASELSSATRISDEAITELMARLTAYRSVSGETFKRTTKAAIDMSEAGFGTLETNAKRLGTILERPDKGLRRLRRTGVVFSEEQERQIKNLVEQNKLFEAQDMILDAVEDRFKGVGEEMAKTPEGRLKQLDNIMSDIREELGRGLLPLLVKFRELQIKAFDNTFVKDFLSAIRLLSFGWRTAWEGMSVFAQLQMAKLRHAILSKFDFPNPFTGESALFGVGEATKIQRDDLQRRFDILKKRLQELETDIGKPVLPERRRELKSGRTGISELGRKIQDILLGDKQDMMIDRLDEANRLGDEQLKELKRLNPGLS